MSKNIVFLIYSKVPTGGLKVLFKVGNGLLNRGFNVTYTIAEDEAAFKLEYQNSCKLVHAPTKVPYRLFSRLGYLLKVNVESDFVIATYFPTAIAGYFNPKIKGKLLYYVQADETHFFSFRLITLVRRFHYYFFAKLSYLLPIEKIINCEGSKASLSKKSTYMEISPGFDPKIYFPRKRKEGKFRIGHISRVERRKGSEEFFLAMKQIQEEGIDIEIYIAYDFCKNTKNVVYQSTMPKDEFELADFYSSCDVVVSTVWEKGFAYPPLETMACGALSISTPIDYGQPGKDHISIPVNDVDAIKRAIKWVMQNPMEANKIKDAGIETASHYSWDQIIDRWESVLK